MTLYCERERILGEDPIPKSYIDWAEKVIVKEEFFKLDCNSFVLKSAVFITDQAKKRGYNGLVVGLSGGVDSAVVAALAAKTDIKTSVVTVVADGFIRKVDIDHATMISRHIGVPQEIIDISGICRSICAMHLPGTHHIIMGIRNAIIKEIAENRNSLLIGTGNKTETYSGLFSANSYLGQVFPLGSLFKSQVYQLAKFLMLPDYIIKKVSHGGVEGEKEDKFLGMSSNVFDIAAAVCDGENVTEVTVPQELLEHIRRNKENADIFFSFPDL